MNAELEKRAAVYERMGDENQFKRRLKTRELRGSIWRGFFIMAIVIALLALLALFVNIVNSAFGYVIVDYAVNPAELTDGRALEELSNEELSLILVEYLERRAPVFIRDNISAVQGEAFATAPMSEIMGDLEFDNAIADLTIRELSAEQMASIFAANFSQSQLLTFVDDNIVRQEVVRTYPLTESLFNRAAIEAEHAANYEGTELIFQSWLNSRFLSVPMSTDALFAGIRTALFGTLWVLFVTVLFAFPIGVGAAIYLEEYAKDESSHAAARKSSQSGFGGWLARVFSGANFSRLIETNIRNLAGVPSIIYGLLGLAIFVRALGDITQGRTILSAGLTMALLILPVIIINAQEAIRAVPSSIREASYGLGATKWQTISRQVLPAAIPGILTGTILAMSRAIGETAPLIVIGASTFILFDPTSPVSRFTALPIQIYSWTSRPQPEFRSLAAATIIVLLVLLLAFNATAIILRQRFRRKLSG